MAVANWKRPITTCANATQTLDLSSSLNVRVTITCNSDQYNEGETTDSTGTLQTQTVRLYTITAVACNGSAGTCPDNTSVTRPGYVERMRVVKVSN